MVLKVQGPEGANADKGQTLGVLNFFPPFQQKNISAEGKGGVKTIIQIHTEGTIYKAVLGESDILESVICHLTATIRLDYITKMYQQIHLT